MIYELPYYQQTEKLIEFYKDKKSPIKEYLITVNNYINELKEIKTIEIYDELEYERAFNQVLELVHETFRPNAFNSIINGANLRLFSDEFILYILSTQKQLKKAIRWQQLCDLQFKFSMAEIKYKIKNGFNSDFTNFAIQNIKLTDLWTIKID